MKKLSIFLAMLLMLCLVMPFSAFAAEEKLFWVTHFEDGSSEGAGAIFTDVDTAGGWWLHVAFKPVDGVENTYEIVETSNGIADGSAISLAIPEGGFVWAINTGNDYISLGHGDGAVDYTSPNCSAAVADAQTWAVGQAFTFSGLDLDAQTVPTTTEGTMWYDDAYQCTATYVVYELAGGDETSEPESDDESDEASEDDSTSAPESESESKAPATSNASAAADEEGGSAVLWIVIAVVGVAVVAVVVVVVLKKK